MPEGVGENDAAGVVKMLLEEYFGSGEGEDRGHYEDIAKFGGLTSCSLSFLRVKACIAGVLAGVLWPAIGCACEIGRLS